MFRYAHSFLGALREQDHAADTGKIVVDSLTYADEANGEPYFHNQIVFCDDTLDSKTQMNV